MLPCMDATTSGALERLTRRHWTAEEKTEYLALFAESDLSAMEFCREFAIPPATFALWRRQAREAEASTFARVEVVPAPSAVVSMDAGMITITLRSARGHEAQMAGLDVSTALAVIERVLGARP